MEKQTDALYCFVVLNYNTIEDTEKCIHSIRTLYSNAQYKIVIVDNASPNGSGIVLEKKYVKSDDVTVIISNENVGFAKGNNIGYIYCKTHFNPDYIIISNSDVEFVQGEFLSDISDIHDKTNFSLLGPDIYNSTNNVHQNPLRVSGISVKEIRKGIMLRKFLVAANSRNGICYFVERVYRRVKGLFRVEKRQIKNNTLYLKEVSNCVLYGACLIFSTNYIRNHELAFYPETFMYYEEDFLWYMLINNKEVTVYSPIINIVHKVNGSTNATYLDLKKRLVFKESQAIQSARKLLKYIKSGCPRIW